MFFTPLAEHALDRETGVLAKILPVTACTSAGGLAERRFLAVRFHIERIVTSHDPKRPNLSANTGIHEALLIARRKDVGSEKPTEFVSLARIPDANAEPRAAIAETLEAVDDERYEVALTRLYRAPHGLDQAHREDDPRPRHAVAPLPLQVARPSRLPSACRRRNGRSRQVPPPLSVTSRWHPAGLARTVQ